MQGIDLSKKMIELADHKTQERAVENVRFEQLDLLDPGLAVTAVRGLMHGTVTPHQLASVFVACAVRVGVFGPLTMFLYNRKNTG